MSINFQPNYYSPKNFQKDSSLYLEKTKPPKHLNITERIKNFFQLFRAFHTNSCTSKVNEKKIDKIIYQEINQVLKDEKFNDFTFVKEVLKGDNLVLIDFIIEKIEARIKEDSSLKLYPHLLDSFDLREAVYNKLQTFAAEVYLIDPGTIQQFQQDYKIKQIKESILDQEKKLIRELNGVKVALKDFPKTELESRLKTNEKILKFIKQDSNKIDELKKENQLIEEILNNWDQREQLAAGHHEVTLTKIVINIANISEAKIELLTNLKNKLLSDIKNNTEPQKTKLNQLKMISSILYAVKNYDSIVERNNGLLAKKLASLNPLYVNFQALAESSLTSSNQDVVSNAWKKALCFLSNLSKSEDSVNAELAKRKYFEAYQVLKTLSEGLKGTAFKELLNLHEKSIYFLPINALSINKQTTNYSHKYLSENEIEQLRRFSKILKYKKFSPEKLSKIKEEDKVLLEQFLSRAIDNRDLNKRLIKLGGKIPFGISQEAVSLLRSLSYKTKEHFQFVRLSKKALNLVDKLDSPDEILDSEKLSLKEFGLLKNLKSLAPILNTLKACQILKENSYLSLLQEKSNQMVDVIEIFDQKFQEEVNESDLYRNGDIATWNSKHWQEFLQKNDSWEVLLMQKFITDLGHSTYLYKEPTEDSDFKILKQSHIYGLHTNENVSIQNAAFSDVWRLSVPSLLDKKSQNYQILKEIYLREGKDIDEEVQKEYERIAYEFHADTEKNRDKFSNMENDSKRRFAAGKADYGLNGGHRHLKKRNDHFTKIHEQFAGINMSKNHKKIICSEFVAKAIISSLLETNKRLQEKIRDFAEDHPDTYGSKKLTEETILQIPYDTKERLKRLHPGRMIDLLVRKKCIVKVEQPQIIKHIFTNQTFNPKLKTKDLIKKNREAQAFIKQGNVKKALDILEKLVKIKAPASYYQKELSSFGLEPGEWSSIKHQKLIQKDPFFNSNIKFTQVESDGLLLISKLYQKRDQKYQISTKEILVLKKLFLQIYQNPTFNKRISEFIRVQQKNDPSFKVFNSNHLYYLREFSFKTNQIHELFSAAPKLEKIGNLLENFQEDLIPEEDKLTLHDFRIVDSFSNMANMLDWINNLGLCENDSFLGNIHSAVNKLQIGMKQFNARYLKEVDVQSGDLFLDVLNKANAYDEKPFDMTDKVDWLLHLQKKLVNHKFQHAAIGLNDNQGSISMAELDLKFQKSNVDYGRLCIVDAFRFNWQKLITKNGMGHLKRNRQGLKPNDLNLVIQNQVKEKFQKTINELLNDESKFNNIKNSAFRQVTSVLRFNASNTSSGEFNFEEVQKMICSEFVTRVMEFCFIKLNKDLQKEIALDFQRKGVNKTEALELASKVQIIINPVKANQNFAAVHADRLHGIFRDYITPVEQPAFLNKAIIAVAA